MKILFKLFSIKLVAAILGILYTILQVRYFGATRTIEIYFAAQSLVYLVTSLTQSGKLAEIFLPEYHKLNKIKPNLGFQGLNVVINRMFFWGAIIIIGVFILAPYFIQLLVTGFTETDQKEATLIFRVLSPYLFLQVLNSFFITVLNAESKFGRAEFLGLTNTLVNIFVLVIFFQIMGIWALVLSLLLGKIIEFMFYVRQLYKIGFRYLWIFNLPEFNHISFFKTMQSTFLYVGATQIYGFVLTASISFLPEGTYAIFKYVQNLANKVKGLLIQPFMTIFFTQYSNLLQKSKSVNKQFKKYFTSIINVNAVAIIGTILLGDNIINLLWGSDKFDSSNVHLAYIFLIFNIGAVLISSIGGIYRKMAVAHGKGKQLYFYWAFAQLLSAGFTYVLIKYFQINGLYFIIPLNVLFTGLVSYWIYKGTKGAIKYNFLNKANGIGLILIVLAILIKLKSSDLFISDFTNLNFIILGTITFLLSLYPMFDTYKVFKK